MAKFKPIKITQKIDINDLRKEVERANRIYNRRINELRQARLATFSPSYYINYPNGERIKRTIRHVNTGALTRSQLEKEYLYFKDFLDNKTSTVAGVKKYRANMRKRLGVKGNESLFSSDLSTPRKRELALKRERKFWELYNNSNDALKISLMVESKRLIKMLRRITKQRNLTTEEKYNIFNDYMQQLHNSYDQNTQKFTLNDDEFFINKMNEFRKK